jgi:SAM-dependent methyltransferase
MNGTMQNNKSDIINLHIGCGNIRLNNFINVDIIEGPAVDRIMDARKLDFADNSVDLIYTSHVIEHFPHGEVPLVLKEWNRVLKNGGKLIVITPNFDKHVDWYIFRKPFSLMKYMFLHYIVKIDDVDSGRIMTDNFVADVTGGALFPKIAYNYESYHKVIFNPSSLKELAKNVGFYKAEKINLKSDQFPINGIDSKKLHWSSMGFIFYKNNNI